MFLQAGVAALRWIFFGRAPHSAASRVPRGYGCDGDRDEAQDNVRLMTAGDCPMCERCEACGTTRPKVAQATTFTSLFSAPEGASYVLGPLGGGPA